MTEQVADVSVEEYLRRLTRRCSNWGRWGDDDEIGTLNFITPDKRTSAARLVQEGTVVSISRPLSTTADVVNKRPLRIAPVTMNSPNVLGDSIEVACHGAAFTHLDALAHVSWEGKVYNGRAVEDVATGDGLSFASIEAQRHGVFSRGVLLDVAAARAVRYLEPDSFITVADLERAEQLAGVRVESGDVVLVHMGLARHERELGGPLSAERRCGLRADAIEWLYDREAAVFGGDCVERLPYPATMSSPLHVIGLVYMGLVLMDWPDVDMLLAACVERARYEFLFVAAPLPIPGGTGSLTNPLCVF